MPKSVTFLYTNSEIREKGEGGKSLLKLHLKKKKKKKPRRLVTSFLNVFWGWRKERVFVFGGCGSSRFLTRFSTRNGARAAEGPKSGAQLNDPMLFFSPEGDTPPQKKTRN